MRAIFLIGLIAAAGGALAQARSGTEFIGAELKALQEDDFANPGMLWVAEGERLWREAPAGAPSCAQCHGEPAAMKGVSARYPKYDATLGRLLNLEGRINDCRVRRQKAEALAYESQPLLALTALLARQSKGLPLEVSIDGPARAHFESGERLYRRKIGQFNLACTQCHDANVGRRIGTDNVSQGQPNGFPIYRMEWQTLGSLHRRLRACNSGVRAEMLPGGSPEYLDLELYLAWRGRGLPVETPAIRR